MKNTYFKKVTVACVATFAFIGLHNTTAEAITKYELVKVESLSEVGQPYGPVVNKMKEEINNYDEEKEFIPNTPKILALAPAEQKVEEVPVSEPQASEVETEAETPQPVEEAPAVSISNEEKDLFARLVEAEAKGETYEGKVAVATVVLNRVDSSEFPNSITGVINEVVGDAYAFSPVQNGAINNPASDEAIQAVEEALTRQDQLNDCIYFYNPEIATDEWIRSREVVKTIGNHVFAK
jgi:N-acetylmuramoyl-L-alanine amidase